MGDLYDWLLFLHILAAMLWVGGSVMVAAMVTRLLRAPEPGEIARFTGNLRVLGPAVLAPSVVLLLVMGIWMVEDSAAWDMGQGWLEAGIALYAAAFLIGAAFLSRTAIGAERAATAGDHGEAHRQLVRWSWGYRVIVLILLIATWDMVVKPGL
jgi:uncharacterized membrane protein